MIGGSALAKYLAKAKGLGAKGLGAIGGGMERFGEHMGREFLENPKLGAATTIASIGAPVATAAMSNDDEDEGFGDQAAAKIKELLSRLGLG